VLDVSAIEAGRMKIAHDEFDIIALLDDSEVVFDAQASRKKLNFSVERQGVTTRFVVGDAMRVNQILANLISNAVKFTPEGGSVVLRATEMSATDALVHFKFEVEDTGSGMTPEYMSRIFTPFEQENARVAAEHGGSGLGLSIVHNLVKMMDGAIDVKSSVGGGTKFTVTLAFERSHRARETDAVGAVPLDASYDVPPDSLNDYSGNRVLLAEDNPINVEIAQEMLGRFGLNIDRVDNGEDAISTFANSDADTYQMIFMDVQMPRMNGYDATKAIRASGHPQAKTIPIFAMTANAFAEDVSDALAAGMTGHISKPISLYKLQDVLARYLKCKDR
jgi:CheY-like chemotaxis protein